MEKLIEHSLEREENIETMCYYMARGRAILICIYIPLAFLIYFFTPFFKVLHQNE